MACVEYEILIPSRKRVRSSRRAMALLPTARIYVDERERADYVAEYGAERVVTHPPTSGFVEVRRHLIERTDNGCVVMVDDDLVSVVSFMGRKIRVIDDPGSILQIIENGINIVSDLGLKLASWNRRATPMQFKANNPLSFCAPVAGAVVAMPGTPKPDPRLKNYADVDITLRSLLADRVVIVDNRFYFQFGKVWTGKGGSQGIRTEASEQSDRDLIRRNWKGHVSVDHHKTTEGQKYRAVTGMSIRVDRKSDLASTR